MKCIEILDQGKNPKWPVSSYFHSSFSPISRGSIIRICENTKNPETRILPLTPKKTIVLPLVSIGFDLQQPILSFNSTFSTLV